MTQDEAHVHRAECAFVKNEKKSDVYLSNWTIEADIRRTVVLDAWSDFIEESMTEEDALFLTRFMPCVDLLP